MIYASYEPKPDITAYELAVLLPGLVRSPRVFGTGFLTFQTAEWEAIPGNVRRHFVQYHGDIEELTDKERAENSEHALLWALGGHPEQGGA